MMEFTEEEITELLFKITDCPEDYGYYIREGEVCKDDEDGCPRIADADEMVRDIHGSFRRFKNVYDIRGETLNECIENLIENTMKKENFFNIIGR